MEHVLPFKGGTFTQILHSLLDLFVSADRVIVRLGSEYGRTATDEVLAATDLENLSDRLDALASDQEFWDHEIPLNTRQDWEAARVAAASSLDMPSLAKVLGLTAARRCAQGWNAFQSAFQRMDRLKSRLDAMFPELTTDSPEASARRPFTDYSYDLELPPALRRFMRLLLRNAAAACVIGRAEERGQRLEPWLGLGLANAWAEGPERLAVALADPETIVGWFTSIFSHIETGHRFRRAMEGWKQAAAASGEGIYLPFDQPDASVDKES